MPEEHEHTSKELILLTRMPPQRETDDFQQIYKAGMRNPCKGEGCHGFWQLLGFGKSWPTGFKAEGLLSQLCFLGQVWDIPLQFIKSRKVICLCTHIWKCWFMGCKYSIQSLAVYTCAKYKSSMLGIVGLYNMNKTVIITLIWEQVHWTHWIP